MSELAFLSPSRCAPETLTSPLARALREADPELVSDRSRGGKVEIRGDLSLVRPETGEELIRLSPRRAFLFTDFDAAEAAARIRAPGVLAYDATGALAGMSIQGERLMRRLTDLDLDRLPAAGPFADVWAIVLRDEGERFRVYVHQELGHYVAEAVVDAIAGLERTA